MDNETMQDFLLRQILSGEEQHLFLDSKNNRDRLMRAINRDPATLPAIDVSELPHFLGISEDDGDDGCDFDDD